MDAIILIFSSQRGGALAPLELFKTPSLVRKLGGLAFCRRFWGSSGKQLWMEALTHCPKEEGLASEWRDSRPRAWRSRGKEERRD